MTSILAQIHQLRQRLAEKLSFWPLIESIIHRRRAIPPSRGSHVRGWHPVRSGHPAVPFESLLECRVITALARYPGFVGILSQPLTLVYRFAGRVHRYTPDFLVTFNDVPADLHEIGFARETYLEVKPLDRAIEAEDSLHRQLGSLRVATGKSVVLLTEPDVKQLMNKEVSNGR